MLVSPQVLKRLMEYLRREVFHVPSVADAAGDKRIHTMGVELKQLAEATRIALCSFNQQPLGFAFIGLGLGSQPPSQPVSEENARHGEKVTRRKRK